MIISIIVYVKRYNAGHIFTNIDSRSDTMLDAFTSNKMITITS